jgi:hypothetical protein
LLTIIIIHKYLITIIIKMSQHWAEYLEIKKVINCFHKMSKKVKNKQKQKILINLLQQHLNHCLILAKLRKIIIHRISKANKKSQFLHKYLEDQNRKHRHRQRK